jgi:hypothetical protein
MRKVTASAVILTALTGCSQSGIPSTQWSFKVPSVGEASSQSAEAGKEGSADSKLLPKDQLFADAGGNSRMMGPAFEQPPEGTSAGAKASTLGKPGSRESSALSQTYSLSNSLGSGVQASTRPDPVAQVRAYLQASSPTALTNRTPYSSQVYLSSPSGPVSPADGDFAATAASSDYASSDYVAMAQPNVALALPNPSYSADSTAYTALPVAEALPSNGASSYMAAGSESYSPDAYSPQAYSPEVGSSTAAYPSPVVSSPVEATRSSDGLPQLTNSAPNDYTAPPTEPAPTQAVQPEADSIGTAILRDLQRSSGAEAAADTTAPSAAIPSAATAQPQITSVLPNETNANAAVFEAYAPSEVALANSAPSSEPSSYSEPATLDRLTQTMPAREASPLVTNFREANDLSQPSGQPLEAIPLSPNDQSQLPVRNTEAGFQPSEPPSSAPSGSPLLEGLSIDRDASSQSTIYVPIAEAAPTSNWQALVLGVINPLSTEDLASALTDEQMAQADIFSSVLSSPAFSSPTFSSPALLSSLNASNVDAFSKLSSAELTLLQTKIRQEKIALAAQQASKRQRLAWR